MSRLKMIYLMSIVTKELDFAKAEKEITENPDRESYWYDKAIESMVNKAHR